MLHFSPMSHGLILHRSYILTFQMSKEAEKPPLEKLKLIKQKTETGKRQQQPQQQAKVQKHDSDETDKDSIADDASFVAGIKEREKKAPVKFFF